MIFAKLPVCGSDITAPQVNQLPNAAKTAVVYQPALSSKQEQFQTVFPKGVPNVCAFPPVSPPRDQYDLVDSACALVPASMAAVPAELPVDGLAIAAPQVYQQPAAAMPAIAYQPAQDLAQEQLQTVFPVGAPSSCASMPFSQSQNQYEVGDSANAPQLDQEVLNEMVYDAVRELSLIPTSAVVDRVTALQPGVHRDHVLESLLLWSSLSLMSVSEGAEHVIMLSSGFGDGAD